MTKKSVNLERFRLVLVAVVFLFSGAFALVYEVTWARMLSREFGSDAVAIAIIVSVFMLGLGAGARLAGQWGDGLRNPLRVYGCMEVLLSLYVMASPWVIGSFDSILVSMGHGGLENVWLLNGGRTLLGMMALLPPTLLMGATLPVLARFVADRARHVPAGILLFYAINIIGAVVGCLAAGFVLLPALGLSHVLWLVAAANMALGVIAIAMSHRLASPVRRTMPREPVDDPVSGPAGAKLVIAVALVGGASMACQLAWTRSVILVVGGSAYAFAAVLAVFLAGLGLGAMLASGIARTVHRHSRDVFMLVAALSVVSLFASAFVLPGLPVAFLEHFDPAQSGTRLGLMQLQLTIAGLLVLVPAIGMGMLFPLGLRIALGDGARPATDTGRMYLANTLGCVVGALVTGFVLIPQAGILATLLIAAGLICYAIILVQAEIRGPLGQAVLALLVLLGYGAGWSVTPRWDAQLMSSGISEYARNFRNMPARYLPQELARRTELLYYKDGITATVTVSRDRVSRDRDLYIATNGKIDGSSHFDMPTQKLSAHLPLLLHENPREVAVIGLGTGVTAGSATLHEQVDRVKVIEIEPAMVQGARYFSEFNQGVLDSEKAEVTITDGRLHLTLANRAYDVISSEPSNPWIAGVAGLFTEEFYRLGRDALREGGLFAQWLQIYDMETEDVRSVINTFQSVFPHSYVAMTIIGTDLLLLGSTEPVSMDLDRIGARMRQAEVALDLADIRLRINSPEELLARIWMAPAEVREFSRNAPRHRDDWPFLMYRAPLSRYLDTRRLNTAAIAGASAGLLPELLARGSEPDHLDRLSRAYDEYVPRDLRWPDSR